jgi:hypothetical protein
MLVSATPAWTQKGLLTHQDFCESPHDDLRGEKPTSLGHLNLIRPEWPFSLLNRD